LGAAWLQARGQRDALRAEVWKLGHEDAARTEAKVAYRVLLNALSSLSIRARSNDALSIEQFGEWMRANFVDAYNAVLLLASDQVRDAVVELVGAIDARSQEASEKSDAARTADAEVKSGFRLSGGASTHQP